MEKTKIAKIIHDNWDDPEAIAREVQKEYGEEATHIIERLERHGYLRDEL